MGNSADNKRRINRTGRAEFNAKHREYMRAYRQKNPEKYLWMAAKERAKKYGHEFTILQEHVIIPLLCPVLGLPLLKSTNCFKDWSPSIDRIDNTRGYTPDNIVVVSFRANRIKSDATLRDLEMVLTYYKNLKKENGDNA